MPGSVDFRNAPWGGHSQEAEDGGGDLVGFGDDPVSFPGNWPLLPSAPASRTQGSSRANGVIFLAATFNQPLIVYVPVDATPKKGHDDEKVSSTHQGSGLK